MKRTLLIVFIVLTVTLIAWSDEQQSKKDTPKESDESVLIEEHEFSFDELGTFYRFNEVKDVDTYETGLYL